MNLQIEKFEFGTIPDFSLAERVDILTDLLKNEICKVVFMKLDGTEREMKCTLKNDLVPATKQENKKKSAEDTGVLCVYSIDDNGWRSFRVNNVISIEVYDEA